MVETQQKQINSMLNCPPPLDRTPSNHARYLTAGVRCFERDFPGHEKKLPVKLVADFNLRLGCWLFLGIFVKVTQMYTIVNRCYLILNRAYKESSLLELS